MDVDREEGPSEWASSGKIDVNRSCEEVLSQEMRKVFSLLFLSFWFMCGFVMVVALGNFLFDVNPMICISVDLSVCYFIFKFPLDPFFILV